MAAQPAADMPAPVAAGREIGRIAAGEAGAMLIVVAGVHGNEPAGIVAAQRVIALLRKENLMRAGELVAFAGNLKALRQRRRFLDRDLNRVWHDETPVQDNEAGERDELHAAIAAALARRRGAAVLIDLHTSSAPGIPFAVFSDTLAQRGFARALRIPAVLGLAEMIDGALCQFWSQRGCLCVSVEGGQHDAEEAIASHEAVILLCLQRAGLLTPRASPWLARAAAELDRRSAGLPRLLEVLNRHPIAASDQFRMAPGFRNIARVSRDQLLATDRNGQIRAPADGMVILPLYQDSGSDGFFWGRAISPMRQHLQAVLRRLIPAAALTLLPGLRRDPLRSHGFLLEARTATGPRLGMLRALGYRRVRTTAKGVSVERR